MGPAAGDGFQLFRRQLTARFLRDGEKLFRGLRGFDLFLLLVGEGVEDLLGIPPCIQLILYLRDLYYISRSGNTICGSS